MKFPQPTSHVSHDYRALVKRWKAFARSSRLSLKAFARAGEEDLYVMTTGGKAADVNVPYVYISAGVHGDEPAPPWGLLNWAEAHVDLLHRHPFILFPVLNPIGLMLNIRADHRGQDLNRSFNLPDQPVIEAWRSVMGNRLLSLGLCLHEDYDGQGCYLYELNASPKVLGTSILKDTSRIIPSDTRRSIDGRRAKEGLIRRRIPPEMPGHPEAIVLHLLGAPIALTFESPSEFSIAERISVQRVFIESSLKHALGIS